MAGEWYILLDGVVHAARFVAVFVNNDTQRLSFTEISSDTTPLHSSGIAASLHIPETSKQSIVKSIRAIASATTQAENKYRHHHSTASS